MHVGGGGGRCGILVEKSLKGRKLPSPQGLWTMSLQHPGKEEEGKIKESETKRLLGTKGLWTLGMGGGREIKRQLPISPGLSGGGRGRPGPNLMPRGGLKKFQKPIRRRPGGWDPKEKESGKKCRGYCLQMQQRKRKSLRKIRGQMTGHKEKERLC